MEVKRYLDLVRGAARRDPAKEAVVSPDGRITFGELDNRVDRLGSALRSRGYPVGARVALLAANELEYIELQAACVRAGYTFVPLNTRLAMPELQYILGDCEPSIVIAGRTEEQRVIELGAAAGADVAGFGTPAQIEAYDDLLATGGAAVDEDLAADVTVTILYTSGTTGRPKGAMIDRSGVTARVFVNALETRTTAEDVFLMSLPMFHIGAFLVYAYTFTGATVAMLPEFTPAGCLAALQRERATATVLVPTMIQFVMNDPAIASYDASGLRLMIYGGESISPEVLRRAMDIFGCGFHQQYGMTETGCQTILRPEDHDPSDPGVLSSAGTEAASFEVQIMDPDDRPLPDGETGEITCRGPAVMSGYWGLPEVTANTLRNGWMHTGDLGYRDERGYLHIVDRKNDMIVSGGENVYPREVEQVLMAHPDVTDCTVLGLPDAKWGQVVTAVLVDPSPPDEVLAEYLRERIARYKVPKRWMRVDELPRNAAAKVLKAELRARLGS